MEVENIGVAHFSRRLVVSKLGLPHLIVGEGDRNRRGRAG